MRIFKTSVTLCEASQRLHVDAEHLLAAVLAQEDSLVPSVLQKLGVSPTGLATAVQKEIDSKAKLPVSGDRSGYIKAEDLFLGLLDKGGASLTKIFQANGLTRDAVARALTELRADEPITASSQRQS